MLSQKAQEYFLNKKGYNCAQAIIKAFIDLYPDRDKAKFNIDNYKNYGHGGSDGKCGALAGAQIVCNPKFSENIEKGFIEKAGSAKCREIRKSKSLPCNLCVKEAGILAEKYIK